MSDVFDKVVHKTVFFQAAKGEKIKRLVCDHDGGDENKEEEVEEDPVCDKIFTWRFCVHVSETLRRAAPETKNAEELLELCFRWNDGMFRKDGVTVLHQARLYRVCGCCKPSRNGFSHEVVTVTDTENLVLSVEESEGKVCVNTGVGLEIDPNLCNICVNTGVQLEIDPNLCNKITMIWDVERYAILFRRCCVFFQIICQELGLLGKNIPMNVSKTMVGMLLDDFVEITDPDYFFEDLEYFESFALRNENKV